MSSQLERQRDHFNSIAQEYFEARRGKRQVLLHYLLFQELFKGIHVDKPKIKVLEPMCGFGEGRRIIEQFFGSDIIYEGFDYSDEIVKCAKQLDDTAKIYVQDVTTFQTQNKYDIIIIVGGLHHVPNYAKEVVKNMTSILSEGGLFINIEPTYNNWLYKCGCEYIYRKNKLFDAETERRFSWKEMNQIYRTNNLEIERQIYPGLLAYLLWYNPDAFPALNKGSTKLVKWVFALDKLFMHNVIGKKLSVATFSVLKKQDRKMV